LFSYIHFREFFISIFERPLLFKDTYLLAIEKYKEAAEYSNIGQNRISGLLKEPRCPFVLYVGTKKLVKRKEFEKFISESVEI